MKKWCAVLAIVVLGACGDDNDGAGVTVYAGQSIQAAIDAAPPNATIFVEPGVYRESAGAPSAIVVSHNGVHLIARSTPDRPSCWRTPVVRKTESWWRRPTASSFRKRRAPRRASAVR
jgi:hypothetical protein